MEGIPLRNARPGDLPMLLLLWGQMMKENQALDARLAPHPRAQAHMAEQLQRWIQDPERIVLVAEEGKRLLVGYAAAGTAEGADWQVAARVGEITDCFVLAQRRRRGLARRLIGRIEDQLLERGVERIRLQAAAANAGSRAFWEAMGYEVHEVLLERPAAEASAAPADPPEGP